MAQTTLFQRQRLAIESTAGRFVLPPLVILPQTSHIELRIQRPTTLRPLAFGGADRMRGAIIVELDGEEEEYRCAGSITGGIRVNRLGVEIPEYVLRYGLPWGFFGEKGGAATRLGERAKNLYRARIEITSLDGGIDSEIEVFGVDAPAPPVAFHSSVAFDAATDAQEVSGDGVLSLSHAASGSDRGAFAGSCNGSSGGGELSTSITYGGTGMTELWDIVTGGIHNAGYHWPGGSTLPSGSQTVTNTLAAATDEHGLGVISMTGVHQSTPVGTPATTAAATGANPSVSVGSVGADDLVVDHIYAENVPTVGADQNERYSEIAIGGFESMKGSSQLGSLGGTMSWTMASGPRALGAVAFKPADAPWEPEEDSPRKLHVGASALRW